MAVIKSGATTDQWTIDPTSKAGRVTLYDAAGLVQANNSKQTFYASASFTPAATPTDLVTIFGSATKIVKVWSLLFGTANTAAGSQILLLIKRSAVNTTGTFVAATAVPGVTGDAATATSFGHYTANAGALGTAIGTVSTRKIASPVVTPATFAGIVQSAEFEMIPQTTLQTVAKPITLTGIAEGLAVNFNGAALVSGQIHHYGIIWTEE